MEIMCDKNTVNVFFKSLHLRELYQGICQLMTQHLIIASNEFSFEGNREMDKADLAISWSWVMADGGSLYYSLHCWIYLKFSIIYYFK